jgi:hypothetical protein
MILFQYWMSGLTKENKAVFADRYLGRGLMVVFFGSWLLNSVGIIELIKAVNSYA